MRNCPRFFIASARFFCPEVNWNLGKGSETFGTSGTRKTARAATSTRFGLAAFILSSEPLICRMSVMSSTVPFSQVAMINRCESAANGTLVLAGR